MHVIASEQHEEVFFYLKPSTHTQHAPAALSLRVRYILTNTAVMHRVQFATGHGSQTADWSGDEDDGMNETICPCDFQHVSLHLGLDLSNAVEWLPANDQVD